MKKLLISKYLNKKGSPTIYWLIGVWLLCDWLFIYGVDVNLSVKYQKKLYGVNGFSGSILFPLRYSKTEILKCQQAGNNCSLVKTVETDGGGNVSVSVPGLNLGDFISIRLYTTNCPQSTCGDSRNKIINLVVKNLSGTVFTSTVDFTDPIRANSFNANITIPVSASGPFNIFTIIGAGFEFLYDSSGTFAARLPNIPPLLVVRWEPLSTVGTFFQCNSVNGICQPGSSSIFLRGSQADPDEFDDDVILHEFGHYVESNFGRNDSPGGSHSPTSALDLRLAWSEGFANFFSSWCRQWLKDINSLLTPEFASVYTSPYLYIDNIRGGASVLDFETGFLGQGVDYEITVASVLWDIWDDNNELSDALNVILNADGYADFFELFLIFMPSPIPNTPVEQTFERFYDNFLLANGSLLCDLPNLPAQPIEVCLQAMLDQNNSSSYFGDFTEAERIGNISFDLGEGEQPFDLTKDPSLNGIELDLTRKTVTVRGLTLYAGEPTDPPHDPMYQTIFTFNCNNPLEPDEISHKCDWEMFKVFLEHGVKYVFETDNLKDGADTVVEVWTTPPDQTGLSECTQPYCIAQNDDIDPAEAGQDERARKRSKLTFTAPSAGFYYILVHSYDRSDAISTYGGYDFKAGPFKAPQLPAPQSLSGGGGGGGCFIATAVSNNDKNILEPLRQIRDGILLATDIGTNLVKTYYKLAPAIADYVSTDKILKDFIYRALKTFVKDYLSYSTQKK